MLIRNYRRLIVTTAVLLALGFLTDCASSYQCDSVEIILGAEVGVLAVPDLFGRTIVAIAKEGKTIRIQVSGPTAVTTRFPKYFISLANIVTTGENATKICKATIEVRSEDNDQSGPMKINNMGIEYKIERASDGKTLVSTRIPTQVLSGMMIPFEINSKSISVPLSLQED